MADRRLPHGLLWAGFIASILAGAVLILNERPALRAVGLVLIVLPLLLFVGLTLVFYAVDRARAERPR